VVDQLISGTGSGFSGQLTIAQLGTNKEMNIVRNSGGPPSSLARQRP
jgi:hypothetical protein